MQTQTLQSVWKEHPSDRKYSSVANSETMFLFPNVVI